MLSKRGMKWVLLIEQIEIAAGDENSGETGEAEKGLDQRFCLGRFYDAVARTQELSL